MVHCMQRLRPYAARPQVARILQGCSSAPQVGLALQYCIEKTNRGTFLRGFCQGVFCLSRDGFAFRRPFSDVCSGTSFPDVKAPTVKHF